MEQWDRGEYCCNCNSPMIYSSAWSNIQNCLNMAFTHTVGFLKHSLPTQEGRFKSGNVRNFISRTWYCYFVGVG